jgi:hypothetical protein
MCQFSLFTFVQGQTAQQSSCYARFALWSCLNTFCAPPLSAHKEKKEEVCVCGVVVVVGAHMKRYGKGRAATVVVAVLDLLVLFPPPSLRRFRRAAVEAGEMKPRRV